MGCKYAGCKASWVFTACFCRFDRNEKDQRTADWIRWIVVASIRLEIEAPAVSWFQLEFDGTSEMSGGVGLFSSFRLRYK